MYKRQVQNVEKEERPVRPPKKELSRKEEKSEKVQEVPDLLPMSWTASYKMCIRDRKKQLEDNQEKVREYLLEEMVDEYRK